MLASPELKHFTQLIHNFPNHSLLALGLCFQSKDFFENACNHQPIQCLSSALQPGFNVQPRQAFVKNKKEKKNPQHFHTGEN